MGQKKIKVIDLSQEQTKPKKAIKKPLAVEEKVVEKKLAAEKKAPQKTQEKAAKTKEKGKKPAPDEAEKAKKGEKPAKIKAAKTKAVKAASAQKKQRSTRYKILKEKVDRTKNYPLEEAIKLLKTLSTARFEETVELHLTLDKKGPKTEKKFPLAHLKVGKISEKDEELKQKINTLLQSYQALSVKKAVLTATMAPGIKLEVTK